MSRSGAGASRTRNARPYRAAGQIIRKVADIYENDAVDVARDKLAAAVDVAVPRAEADEATRYLSVVLGLGLDEPPDEVVHLRFAARMFVERLAAREPILVVFEDAHWADAPLLELIDYLVSHVRDARVRVPRARATGAVRNQSYVGRRA